MRGAVGSLNAAVAGSILLFEAVAQRDPEGRSQPRSAVPWPEPRRPGRNRAVDPEARPSDADADVDVDVAEPAPEPAQEAAEPAADVPKVDEAPPEMSPAEELQASVDDATASSESDLLPEPSPAVKPPRAKRARPSKST